MTDWPVGKWSGYPHQWMDEKRRMLKEIWNRSDSYATAGTATSHEEIGSGFDVDPTGGSETVNRHECRTGKPVR